MLRPGLSLAEVLVATLLLTVGVGGAVSTVGASARLRARARALEQVVQVAEDRLAWLGSVGCTLGDSSILQTSPLLQRWELVGVAGGRSLVGTLAAPVGPAGPVRLAVDIRYPCR